MHQIFLSPRAAKDLKKLSSDLQARISAVLLKLSKEPFHDLQTKYLKDKKLADFRVRVGDYRILYDVYPKDKVVYVLRIGHRKDIYR